MQFVALPIELRVIVVAMISIVAARLANWAIYNWAFYCRDLGPWTPAPQGFPARSWHDSLPIFGWYRLRRESPVHGPRYWLRPMLIELFFPLAATWYYHFYVSGGTLPTGQALRMLEPQLHWQYSGHFILMFLMTVATFIDFDEQSIPDYVTVPGTVIGLLGAALAPAWLPWHPSRGSVEELHANLPDGWPLWLNGHYGLLVALLIVVIWGFALLERRWIIRRGVRKGVQYFVARMFRNTALWRMVLVVTLLIMLGVSAAWLVQLQRWPYLMSSLLGMAFAGGVTWAVRLSATWGLRMEALGFGDVTLMAMIGTYVGWQPSLLIFFIAPLVSIVFVLLRWIVTGDAATPYGPYLCAATVLLLVGWDALWNRWAADLFSLGAGTIVGIVVACVVLMGAMLWIWRLIKEALGIAGP